jgi:hypothetical protein|tara:strand:- start:52 stop:414 length:363 start_codon:yes stop_codon:yes gene_type:complete
MILTLKEKKMHYCYIGISTVPTELYALTLGHTGDIGYRTYIKQMTVVHCTSYASKALAIAAEKRALSWVKKHYSKALVANGKWAHPNHSPTRTNDWFFVEDRVVFMREVIALLQRDYNAS